MKNVFFALMALGMFQAAFADEQDFLDFADIGEESVLTVDKNIIFPSGNDESYSYNIGNYETREIGSGSDLEIKKGNYLAGCLVNLVDSSQRVVMIPAGTKLVIDYVSYDSQDEAYKIKLKDSRFDEIVCGSGFAISDHDGSPAITRQDIVNDDVTFDEKERMTLAEFNIRMAGIFSVDPSDFLVLGANDSDRNIAAEKESTEDSEAQAPSASQE